MFIVELFNKWSATIAHKIKCKSLDEAAYIAKDWENKELWDVMIIEIVEDVQEITNEPRQSLHSKEN